MRNIKVLGRQAGFSLASLSILMGVVVPATMPAFASADTLASRSIAMTSSAKDTDADYTLTFTPSGSRTFESIVIDWCADSPVIGETDCDPPTGFDANDATVTATTGAGLGVPAVQAASTEAHTYIKGTTPVSGTSEFSIGLTGVHNPSTVGAFYARVYTYNTDTPDYTATDDLGDLLVDSGGVALSTVDAIGVSAAVRETLTFCVANIDITASCANTAGHAPSLVLGEGDPGEQALTSTVVSEGTDYAQLSTNAAHGAVVKMKNSNDCGGLKRNISGVTDCDIAPAPTNSGDDFLFGTALFGLKLGSQTSATGGTASGSLVPNASYGSYYMEFEDDNTAGVTSPYGGSIFSTTGPVNNKNMPLTFAATSSNDTPAGLYTATMSLIATGTY